MSYLLRYAQNSSNDSTLSPLRSRVLMIASATDSVTFQSPCWARAVLNSAAVMNPSPSVSIRWKCLRASSMSATDPPLLFVFPCRSGILPLVRLTARVRLQRGDHPRELVLEGPYRCPLQDAQQFAVAGEAD